MYSFTSSSSHLADNSDLRISSALHFRTISLSINLKSLFMRQIVEPLNIFLQSKLISHFHYKNTHVLCYVYHIFTFSAIITCDSDIILLKIDKIKVSCDSNLNPKLKYRTIHTNTRNCYYGNIMLYSPTILRLEDLRLITHGLLNNQ